MYVDQVYEMVERECKGVDAIYEDYIIYLVGVKGLKALIQNRLLETCGVINEKQLYTLCDKKNLKKRS